MARPTTTTKTAVSLPTTLYERLEAVRTERGLSRSGAVAEAVAAYVSRNDADLTARIDAALDGIEGGGPHADDAAQDRFSLAAAHRTFARLDAEDGAYPPPRAVREQAPRPAGRSTKAGGRSGAPRRSRSAR